LRNPVIEYKKELEIMSSLPLQKKYEEYAYVLDFNPHCKSKMIRGREGPILQAIGEERLTLLEILALNGVEFKVGERIYIGKEGRTKVVSVLGKLIHEELSNDAVSELETIAELVIKNNEDQYIEIFNSLHPVTPRLHALELIPGIGKTFMNQIINERSRLPFKNFDNLQERTGIKEPTKLIAKRIVEEISGSSRVNLFVHR
jgi:putative nucleotide binding protein|tara:strand:+ start:2044 stop:2649 length:606 start_codon:yes stop_codon:yes gene_type:complete